MRPLVEKHLKELEAKDEWFRDVLSKKTTIPTDQETWAVAPDVGKLLYELVLEHKPRRIVEVGMSLGYSTIWLAEAAQSYGGVIDTYETERGKIRQAEARFRDLGYDDVIAIHHMEALFGLSHRHDPIDFLFLDARKREYAPILQAVNHLIPTEGWVIADDVIEWRRKLNDFFALLAAHPYDMRIEKMGHGVSLAKKI